MKTGVEVLFLLILAGTSAGATASDLGLTLRQLPEADLDAVERETGYRVGVFDSYTYYVDENRVLQRLRADSTGATSQPVAINIGSLQVSLGLDTNGDNQVDAWMSAPTAADIAGNRVIGMRITVLGRTNRTVTGWIEPATTFQVSDLDIDDVDRAAKWRRIQVEAALRNYLF